MIQNTEVIENHVIGPIITNISENGGFDGTPSELYELLEQKAFVMKINNKVQGYPKAPQSLTRRLNEIKTNLQDIGIYIEIGSKGSGDNKSRNIKIWKKPSLSFQPSEQNQINGQNAKDDRDANILKHDNINIIEEKVQNE